VIWGLLCALTVVSVSLAENAGLRGYASAIIVLIASIKSRMVIVHFMEVGQAAKHWGVLYAAWNAVVATTLIIGYLMSVGVVPRLS